MSNERTAGADRLDRYLKQARASVPTIAPHKARAAQQQGAALIDIRESWETAEGIPAGALTIARGRLELDIDQHVSETQRPIILVCAAGDRSALSALSLMEMGYERVYNLEDGWQGWRAAGLPVDRPRMLDDRAQARYLRHLAIDEVGAAGQQRLLHSRVFIAGAGGLGSPAALYLAAAGVGRITLVDDDVVERSNLQRQILHSDHLVGHRKTDSAAQRLNALNPDIRVDTAAVRMDADSLAELIAGHDVVVDGTDNFPTRYALNDACISAGVPMVYGAVLRFSGQVGVFRAGDGRSPCYRCLFPEAPAPEDAPSCAEAGVLGVMPGVIGTLQATETLKLLLGIGQSLTSRLIHFDALGARFRETRLVRDPDCRYCAADRRG